VRWNADPVDMRCLIVDDNVAFLDAARELLERQGVTVVGTVSTGADAVRQAGELQPDLTLIDVELGDESGFDLAHAVAVVHPAGRVVMISTYAEHDLGELVATSPVSGFVSKSDLSREALDALLDHCGGAPPSF
jgi:two-component system nitrate/nitrite response regulator NarL